MKKLMTIAAVIATLAITATSSMALTYNQVQEIKKTVLGVPVPEMPAKAAEVVSKADTKDRQAVAVTAVRAIVMKHRAAAPLVISAISKVAPELAPTVAVIAAEIVADQASVIAKAAAVSAPAQAKEISSQMVRAFPSQSSGIQASVGQRGAAHHATPSHGRVEVHNEPINENNPQFPTQPPTPANNSVVIYNQPPQD